MAVLLAVKKRLIVFLCGLTDDFQLCGIVLDLVQVSPGRVFLRQKILADNPFRHGAHAFAHLKIDKSQKVPCLYVRAVQFKACP